MRTTRLAALVALLGGCYLGRGERWAPAQFGQEPGWRSIAVSEIRQIGVLDCGAAATAMVLAYWGRPADQAELRAASGVSAERGLRADVLRAQLRARGLEAALFEGTVRDLEHEVTAGRPVIVGVHKPYSDRRGVAHYLVVVGVHRHRQQLVVIDPADGWRVYAYADFLREWEPTRRLTLAASPPQRSLHDVTTTHAPSPTTPRSHP